MKRFLTIEKKTVRKFSKILCLGARNIDISRPLCDILDFLGYVCVYIFLWKIYKIKTASLKWIK